MKKKATKEIILKADDFMLGDLLESDSLSQFATERLALMEQYIAKREDEIT